MRTSAPENTASVSRQRTGAILIANPTAGSYTQHQRQIEETIAFLQSHGWQVDLRLTRVAGEARTLAEEAVAQHMDIVVAIGGDGTINEIIQELAGSETALGILPTGTMNVWAREIGIPLDSEGAQEILLHGRVRRIDLGKVNERYFLLMAGIGFDGEVTHAVEKRPAKRLGILGYLLVGAWLGLGYPAFRAMIEIDGRLMKTNALQIIIGNTQLYAGAMKYTWKARCDDGLLDICIVRRQSMVGRIIVMMSFLFNHSHRSRLVRYEKGRSVTVYTRYPVAIQIDGDPAGYTSVEEPIEVSIAPRVLKVIVPQQAPAELFSDEA